MIRYSITATGTPDSKTRIRAALKMMGFTSVVLTEKPLEASAPPPKPDNLPTSPEALAVAKLFKREPLTPWADEEIKAFKVAVKSTLLTLENMKIITAFYERERKKPEHFCRRSILQLCKHIGTELDKARAAKPGGSKALEWADSRKIVPMDPQASPAEVEAGLAQLRALREARGAV